MGSATRISNYAAQGVAQLISMYSKPRGAIVALVPVILSVTPNTGPTAGGTLFRIVGYNFEGVSVTVGGVPVVNPIVGGGVITCFSPVGLAGARDIAVTGPAGTATLANGFTYVGAVAPAPTVTSLTPNTGSSAGGTAITNLAGTGFVNGATVTIGGAPCTSVVWVSSTQLTCVTPAGTTGARSVVVTNPDTQSGTLANGFTYSASGTVPVVSAVSYGVVDTAGGGQPVVVTVNSSTGCTSIRSPGHTTWGSFTIVDATHVSGIPVAHAAGVDDVIVSNATGDSTTGTGLIEYWDWTVESPTELHLPGAYTAGSFPDASGNSRALSQGVGANQPSAFSGMPDFDGSNDFLTTSSIISDVVTAGAGTICAIIGADSAAAPGSPFAEPALMTDTGGDYLMMTYTTSGIRAVVSDGAYKSIYGAAGLTGGHLGVMRWDGTNLKLTVDSTAQAPVACGNLANLTRTMNVGSNFTGGGAFYDGRIKLLAFFATAKSDAVVAKMYAWSLQRGLT